MSDSDTNSYDSDSADASSDLSSIKSLKSEEKAETDIADSNLSDAEVKHKPMSGNDQRSKMTDRFLGLKSKDRLAREHTAFRMEEGLKNLLQRHCSSELASICHTLDLQAKLLQEAQLSIDQIMTFAKNGKREVKEDKAILILSSMWDEALFEYLASIGHPCFSIRGNVREIVMKIWRNGGLVDENRVFVPQYQKRELKNRSQWAISKDVTGRLNDLAEMQGRVKIAESDMILNHDYAGIHEYLKRMNMLRIKETSVRDYVISEMEIARSKEEAMLSKAELQRNDLSCYEVLFVNACSVLNEENARHESAYEIQMSAFLKDQSDMRRLSDIIESFVISSRDRMRRGGGTSGLKPLKLQNPENSSFVIRDFHKHLQKYRKVKNKSERNIRKRIASAYSEIHQLRDYIKSLQQSIVDQKNRTIDNDNRLFHCKKELSVCAKEMVKMNVQFQVGCQESWESSLRLVSDR